MTLYELLIDYKHKELITLRELANRLNMTRMTLNNIKRERPSLTAYINISNLLDITIDELLTYPIKNDK